MVGVALKGTWVGGFGEGRLCFPREECSERGQREGTGECDLTDLQSKKIKLLGDIVYTIPGISAMKDHFASSVLPTPSVKGNFTAYGTAKRVKNIFFSNPCKTKS